jgi:aminoglycoside phosphotransferase (APT) family kinase protein
VIRPTELVLFLETISSAVSNELRPDLQSGQAQKSADFLIQVLNRLVAQVRDGNHIGSEQLACWQELRQRMPGVTGHAKAPVASSLKGGLSQLDLELDSIQEFLLDDRYFDAFAVGLETPESAQAAWLREAASATHHWWESIEASVVHPKAKQPAASSAEDPEQVRAKLSGYLEQKFPALPSGAVTDLRIAAGGSTKLTALFSLQPNSALPQRLVLRQDLAVNLTGKLIKDEYPIVERLSQLGLQVPKPILLEADAKIMGGAFMIMTEIVGATPAGTYFARDRALHPRMIGPQFARDAAAELARLHQLTACEVRDPAALATAHRQSVRKAYQHWKSIDKPPQSLAIDLGFAWLLSHSPSADRPRCLTHGDYGVHNMMAKDGRLAAVLDWELAQEDDPAIDLAECQMLMCEDTLPWSEFVAAYLAAGGDPRACDEATITYYGVWMYTVKFGLMVADGRNCFIQGQRTDSLTASVATHSVDRILQYLGRALHTATTSGSAS